MVQFHFHSWTWTPSFAREARRKAGAEAGRSGATHSPPDEVNSRNVNLLGRPNRAPSPSRRSSISIENHIVWSPQEGAQRLGHPLTRCGQKPARNPAAQQTNKNFLDVIHRAT